MKDFLHLNVRQDKKVNKITENINIIKTCQKMANNVCVCVSVYTYICSFTF